MFVGVETGSLLTNCSFENMAIMQEDIIVDLLCLYVCVCVCESVKCI